MEGNVQVVPRMPPATKPPTMVFQQSSCSRRLAAAFRKNMYDPPIAAAACQRKAAGRGGKAGELTECANCAAGTRENAERTDVPLRERVLDGTDAEAEAPKDQSAPGGEPNCVAAPERGGRGFCHLYGAYAVCGMRGCGVLVLMEG